MTLTNWVLFLWERSENLDELEAFEKQLEYSDEHLVEEYLVSSKMIELVGNKIEKFEIIEKRTELTYLSILKFDPQESLNSSNS